MRLTKLVFTIVAILTMAISCSISPDNSGVDVVVSLEDKSITESTLIPDYIPDVETYTVSLAEIVYKNGEWQIADGYSRITENFPGSTKEFRFENVRLGTYAVSIEALDEKSLPILNGSGVENLSVTANGLNTVTVELAAISDATYTGSASMTFDWADVALTNDTVKNAMEEGGLVFILYRYDEAEKTWIEAGRSEATGKEATRLEFVVDKLPVSSGLRLKYAIATASGMMLNPILTTPIAQIYANLTSVQDVNGDKIYRINANEISSATNVYDVNSKGLTELALRFNKGINTCLIDGCTCFVVLKLRICFHSLIFAVTVYSAAVECGNISLHISVVAPNCFIFIYPFSISCIVFFHISYISLSSIYTGSINAISFPYLSLS